jgi:hypothetical protein
VEPDGGCNENDASKLSMRTGVVMTLGSHPDQDIVQEEAT